VADARGFFAELKRRNVVRAALVYAAAVWALAQGIAQLTPVVGAPDWVARWFLVAACIGFPFWIAFAWFYAWTPEGLKREEEADSSPAFTRGTGRKLDFWIIGILAVAVVLLLTNTFVLHRDATGKANVADAKATMATLANVPPKSIAVLPFENLSNDKNNDYFVAGMQDLILTKLADVGDLKIISRTSTEKYKSRPDNLKQVAAELGVATLLEGSVQKHGNEVLINVQLIDARSDAHIWAQAYPRTLDNIFGVEGEVAQKIARALKARLSATENSSLTEIPTTNQAAYDLFLRADYLLNQATVHYTSAPLKSAIPLYEQAVAKDAKFALASAHLSYAQSLLAWFGSGGLDPKQLNTDARANAEHALALQPGLSDAHLALGYCDYYGKGDYDAALVQFGEARKTRPGGVDAMEATAFVLRRQDRYDEAIHWLGEAAARDPRNADLMGQLAYTNAIARHYAVADPQYRRALALDPGNVNLKVRYAIALAAMGDVERAMGLVQGDDPQLKSQQANLLWLQRDYHRALAVLQSIPDTPDNFSYLRGTKATQLADLYLQIGDKERARSLYQQALPQARAELDVEGYTTIQMSRVWGNIGSIEVGLGHEAEALQAIGRSLELVEKSGDHLLGTAQMGVCAALYAEAGRADLAVPLLEKLLAMPNGGLIESPALLRIDPTWDPIRNDPHFVALLERYPTDSIERASAIAADD
jgi:TolB-like protein/Tfp pilus assembly protein PilF